MPHLYDYSQTFINLAALLDDEACATDEVLEAAINAESNFIEKAKNIAIWIKNKEGDIESFGKEIKRLQGKKTALENKSKWLREYLKREMNKTGIKKINGIVPIGFHKCPPSVEIINAELIPFLYLNDPLPPTIDKTTILNALKTGVEIPGVRLIIDKENLKIG